jgi:antitoxin (DNA-binding transcriptional repressor) of toxin-antitoxin stability system
MADKEVKAGSQIEITKSCYLLAKIRTLEKELSKALHSLSEANRKVDNECYWEKRCGELQERLRIMERRENQRLNNRYEYKQQFVS